jgi:3-oxoacyl-[acyl-carrier protein] reductase
MGKLDGRVAIITGGGRGIGAATSELFASEGARIVVATRTAAPGQAVVDRIRAMGGDAHLVTMDAGDRSAVRALIDETVRVYGKIDIVLHNAAYIPFGAIGELSDEDLDKVFDVGLKACFWLAADALPYLEDSPHARFLVTSSLAGTTRHFPNLVHYCSFKAGVGGFIRAAALEFARKGINVSGVEPGLILGHALQENASREAIDQMSSVIPIPRVGRPIEIAHGFLYLASDEAAYITGQTIAIDGGISAGRLDSLKFDKQD